MVIFSMVKVIRRKDELVEFPKWVTAEPHGRQLCERATVRNNWIVDAILRDEDIWSHDHDTFAAQKRTDDGPAEPALLLSTVVEVTQEGVDGDGDGKDDFQLAVLELYKQGGGMKLVFTGDGAQPPLAIPYEHIMSIERASGGYYFLFGISVRLKDERTVESDTGSVRSHADRTMEWLASVEAVLEGRSASLVEMGKPVRILASSPTPPPDL